jgi:hypothetical protein
MLPFEADHDSEPTPEAIALMLATICWQDDMLIPLPVAA